MIDITGTPEVGERQQDAEPPADAPLRSDDVRQDARDALRRPTRATGSVGLYSVWNEPNLQLFLTPQYVGKKIVGPANYAKLLQGGVRRIKAGNPAAQVAIGETSARGRDKPLADGVSASRRARRPSRGCSRRSRGCRFDAWAHHPYPTSPNLPPMQKVRYPNVTLSTLPQFEKDLKKWFHRTVPIWITEYGHETKPGEPHGVSTATQAAYAKQALTIAKADPNVQMFIWFTFRDSVGQPVAERARGSHRRAQAGVRELLRARRALTDGQTVPAKAGKAPTITIYVPYLSYYSRDRVRRSASSTRSSTGTQGRRVRTRRRRRSGSTSRSPFVPAFKPVKGHTYSVVAVANEPNGHSETRTTVVDAPDDGPGSCAPQARSARA